MTRRRPFAACRLCQLLLLALLTACTQHPVLPVGEVPLPLPLQLHVQRQMASDVQDRLLVIQADRAGLRWTLLDPLGMPLARQRLVDGRWHADGLLPPNPEARVLFAAVLFALTPDELLPTRYPQARREHRRRWLDEAGWQVRYDSARRFDLDVGNALAYRVAPLDGAPQP